MKNPWKVRPIVKKDKKRKRTIPKNTRNNSMFIDPFKSKRAIKPVKTKNNFANQNITFNPRPRQHRKPIPRNPNKDLSYPQARKKYGQSITPYGNFDRDMHLNMFDCRPFDKTRHKVPEKYKKKKIFSFAWDKPKTFEESWQEVEKRFPKAFVKREERYSELYKEHLLKREQRQKEFKEKYGKNPLMDVVGKYNLEVENTPENTLLFLHYIQNYLQRENPYDEYEFDIENPTKVKRIVSRDPRKFEKRIAYELYKTHPNKLQRDELERVKDEAERMAMEQPIVKENVRLATLLKNAPKSVKDHMAHLSPNQNFKMVITDAPEELLAKSTGWGVGSCESLVSGGSEIGCFTDIEWNNGIVWFYSEGKTPGKDNPSGRILLKWGINQKDKKPDIIIEEAVYGYKGTNMEVALRYALQEWLKKRGHARGTTETPYSYEGYSDLAGGGHRKLRSKTFSKEWIKKPTKDIHKIKSKYLEGLRQEEQPQYWKRIPEGVQTEFASETDPDVLKEFSKQRGLSRVSMKRILQRAKEQRDQPLASRAIRNPTLKGGALDVAQDFVLENPQYMDEFMHVHSGKLPLEKLRQFLSKPASGTYENTYITIASREGLTEKEVNRLIDIAITIGSIDVLRQLENYYRISDKIVKKLIKSDSPLRKNIFQFTQYETNIAKQVLSTLKSNQTSANQIASEIIRISISQRDDPKDTTELIILAPLDWQNKLDLFFHDAEISDPSIVYEFLSSIMADFPNKKYEIMQYLVEYEHDRLAIPFIDDFIGTTTNANILYVLSESKNLQLHQYEKIMNVVNQKIKKKGKITTEVEPILKELASNESFGVPINEISRIIGEDKEAAEFFTSLPQQHQKYMVALLKFGESIENVTGIINEFL